MFFDLRQWTINAQSIICVHIYIIFPVFWNTYTWPIYSSSGHRSIFCGVSVVCGRDAVNPALSKGQGQLWVMEYDWRMTWSATPKIFHHPQWELKKNSIRFMWCSTFLTGSRTTALMVAWSWSHMISTCEQWMLLIEPGTCVSPLFPKLQQKCQECEIGKQTVSTIRIPSWPDVIPRSWMTYSIFWGL